MNHDTEERSMELTVPEEILTETEEVSVTEISSASMEFETETVEMQETETEIEPESVSSAEPSAESDPVPESGLESLSSSDEETVSLTETEPSAVAPVSPAPETTDTEDHWDFPMASLTMAEGTVANADNLYKIVNGYNGALIPLAGLAYNSVTIVKGPSAPSTGYAFFASAPKAGVSPTYATGYKRVIWTDAASVTAVIPENAAYLYVYHHSKSVYHIPESIRFFNDPSVHHGKAANQFTLATWNIGHFSGGSRPNSTITDAVFAEKSAVYRDFIYNAVRADVFCLNEYSSLFTPTRPARTSLFDAYPTAYEGGQYHYSCNALFSKVATQNIVQHRFECNEHATITHTNLISASDYYYITANLNIAGKNVKLVSTHLGFDKNLNPDTLNLAQIQELIELFRNEERVIILGDSNSRDFSFFSKYTEAGFALANYDGTLSTIQGWNVALDNIIYKGVGVSNFTLLGTDLSDHYAISCLVTVY